MLVHIFGALSIVFRCQRPARTKYATWLLNELLPLSKNNVFLALTTKLILNLQCVGLV